MHVQYRLIALHCTVLFCFEPYVTKEIEPVYISVRSVVHTLDTGRVVHVHCIVMSLT